MAWWDSQRPLLWKLRRGYYLQRALPWLGADAAGTTAIDKRIAQGEDAESARDALLEKNSLLVNL